MVSATLEKTIADLLRHILEDRRINQRKLAAYLDVSPQAVSEWMKGVRVPDPPYVWKIAEMAHVPVEDAMRMAGHLPPVAPDVAPPAIIPPIASALGAMTEAEQRRFALKAIRLAEELIREAREQAE